MHNNHDLKHARYDTKQFIDEKQFSTLIVDFFNVKLYQKVCINNQLLLHFICQIIKDIF